MTLNELIERLEEIRDEVGGGTTVRGVFQPNYPLIARIDAVTTITDSGKADGVFIGLAEAKEYGCSDHYADDFVSLEEDED